MRIEEACSIEPGRGALLHFTREQARAIACLLLTDPYKDGMAREGYAIAQWLHRTHDAVKAREAAADMKAASDYYREAMEDVTDERV